MYLNIIRVVVSGDESSDEKARERPVLEPIDIYDSSGPLWSDGPTPTIFYWWDAAKTTAGLLQTPPRLGLVCYLNANINDSQLLY